MKKLGIFMASLLLLAACSDDKAATPPAEEPAAETEQEVAAEQQQKEMTEEGFITQVTADKVLVNNIYFAIPENLELHFDNGGKESEAVISDIRAGMKVKVEYKGPLKQSFPLEAQADAISILTDEDSKSQSDALLAFIKEEQLSRLLMLGQPIVRDNKIGFLFTNMENGKMSEVKIDLDTHEYTFGKE